MSNEHAQTALAALEAPAVYVAQLERLHRAAQDKGQSLPVWEGLDLTDLTARRQSLARLLAADVRRGRYELRSAVQSRALIEGKWRTLYRHHPLDAVVLGALGEALSRACEPVFGESLYSYRKGRSSQQALRAFVAHLRCHRRRLPKRSRGLYVLRRDIRRYGESIPTEADSPLWAMLRQSLPPDRPRWLLPLVERALRPVVERPDGSRFRLERGVPTGSPLQPAIANLYLGSLDQALERIPGGFYARFGDDILFAHPDASTCARIGREIDERVAALHLEIHPDKREDLYFTLPGRPSHDWPQARPTSFVEFLGFRIGFDGALGLKSGKRRAFLHQVRRRLRNLSNLVEGLPEPERVALVCRALDAAFDPQQACCVSQAMHLRHHVSDRKQLKEIDHAVALEVSQALSGRRGVRAFRRIPPRVLRHQGGLISFTRERDRR